CRAGVGGSKCDHCLPGFWGLHLIAAACGCSAFGSSRSDCEQSTGRCECSRGARGKTCDRCMDDYVMTASGCVEKEEFRAPRSCSTLECHHGAKCVESRSGLPNCECPTHCDVGHLGIDSSEPRERSNREKDSSVLQYLPPCTSSSDCKAIGAVCEPIDAFSGMCKCSMGEVFLRGRCRADKKSTLNLDVEEDRVYGIDKQDLHLHMNISLQINHVLPY
ncbi:laminin EGF-like protein, partial [Ostertagia ostertagi]